MRPFIIPSTEKILKESPSIEITEFKFKIKLLNEISFPKMFLPISLIEPDIK